MQAETTTCKGTRKDGSPCGSTILGQSGWCYLHDPANRPRLQEIHAAGGRAKSTANRSAKLVPVLLRPVLDQLLAALPKIEAGDLDPRQASALASVAGAVVKVYQVGALEERVAALEAASDAPKGAA